MNQTGRDSLDEIKRRSGEFVNARNWQTYQTPKNLSMAMAVEAAELLEHFQWLSEAESMAPDSGKREEIAEELSDVLIYIVRIADVLDIDLATSALNKIARNEEKYPRGRASEGPVRQR